MSKGDYIPELPCERLIRKLCGSQWRNLSKPEIDAAWGVAIVKSILDGVKPEARELSSHLGVDGDNIIEAYRRLNLNGIFKGKTLAADRECLEGSETLASLAAWGYYGGFASGATGVGSR